MTTVTASIADPGVVPTPHARGHYVALDGLRGVAAISVLAFHLGHWLDRPGLASNAWLAVDFFFCLSGYVLCYAYQARLAAGMGTAAFMKVRLIRLMPVIVLGTVISAAYLGLRIVALHYPARPSAAALATLLGLLCLPYLAAPKPIGGPQVFPLNGPQYTLFLELVVNLLWAALRRIESFAVAVALAAAGFAAVAAWGGQGDTSQTFWHGFPRVIGGYYAGAAMFHAQRRWPALASPLVGRLFVPLALAMLAVFYLPFALPRWGQLAWSALGTPLLVLAGSRVALRGAARRIGTALGALSFPIYGLHYPVFVWVNAAYQQAMHRRDFAAIAPLTLVAVLVASWLALKLYDEPVRRWLTKADRRRAPG